MKGRKEVERKEGRKEGEGRKEDRKEGSEGIEGRKEERKATGS